MQDVLINDNQANSENSKSPICEFLTPSNPLSLSTSGCTTSLSNVLMQPSQQASLWVMCDVHTVYILETGNLTENKSDSIRKNFDSIHWQWHWDRGKGRTVARPKFLAVKKIVRKSCLKMSVWKCKISALFGGKFKAKISILSTVGNLQLFLSEFCQKFEVSVRKFATSGSVYFANLRRRCSLVNFEKFFSWILSCSLAL